MQHADPVRPLVAMIHGAPLIGAPGSAAGAEDDLVDDVVAQDAVWGDPIIGEEENGDGGALVCKPCAGYEHRDAPWCGPRQLPSPKEMTPAANAEH